MIVTDKNGQRVTRPNGVLEDGDTIRVPMSFMDAQNPDLVTAAALAGSVRRDVTTLAPQSAQEKARLDRIKRTGEAWQQPPKIGELIKTARKDTDLTNLTPSEARAARTCDAWKKPTSVTDATATAKEQVAIVGASAPLEQLHAAREAAVTARDRRTANAWRR